MTRIARAGGGWNNADADIIELAEYDPAWPAQFAGEAEALRGVLPVRLDVTIEHIGSTSVPGLLAKPIVDIMLVVPERRRWPELIGPVQSLGYVYWAENPAPHHLFFVKGMPPFGTRRTHHVHVRRPEEARPHCAFRDYLIAHPGDAARYAALKRALAGRFETDRDAYTTGKSDFVNEILSKTEG